MKRPLRVTHGGETATLIEWARRAGVSPNVMWARAARLGAGVAVARSIAHPGAWPRGSKYVPRPYVRCKAEGCERTARTQNLCFKHFCAAVRR